MVIARKRVLPQNSYGKGAALAQGMSMPFSPACASSVCGP